MGATHLTARTDDDGNTIPALRFQEVVNGAVVAVPLDGNGVSCTGTFHSFDLETIRSVRQGDVSARFSIDYSTTC
ncbi:hypothetical protein EKO23_20875 [Nocardioides guangzhouensis]|uniref:Uncharacterized protein n=1 Tax=Nocardioides guangzhouensis TaxID=2497878 RepID=A0A4Q4Z533_9ACTN|nr:hypothetical protein [Nocardioides guangzhouensis]RYP82857.1 hypothetical protein EKO23_20875 [Nocardioides guangzhouensis]